MAMNTAAVIDRGDGASLAGVMAMVVATAATSTERNRTNKKATR
jgi:hypothetical protein